MLVLYQRARQTGDMSSLTGTRVWSSFSHDLLLLHGLLISSLYAVDASLVSLCELVERDISIGMQ